MKFNSKREAQEVLKKMEDIIGRYGYVSVADFKDLIGEECSYTDITKGWTDISEAKIVHLLEGKRRCKHTIELPGPKEIWIEL